MKFSLGRKVFPINSLPACRLVDAGIDELSRNADVKFEAACRYYHAINADVLFYFSDIALQAEAMGAEVSYSRSAMPAIRKPAKCVETPPPSKVPGMAANADVLRRMAREFPGRHRAALVYGPFTVAGQVAGEQAVLRGVVENPREVLGLVDKALRLARDYADLLLAAGADVLWVADPLASLLPPESFRRFAGEPLAHLFHACTSGPTVLHICGDTSHILQEMLETGVRGISFDQCMQLPVFEDRIPEDIGIIGNLDPVDAVELQSPDGVAESVEDLVAMMGVMDNFALSTGCALPPSTPMENVSRFVEAGRRCLARPAPHARRLERLTEAVHRGDREVIPGLLRDSLDHGAPPLMVLNSALMRAVRKGSARFDAKECYLPEILLIVDAFYEGFQVLKPRMESEENRPPDIILGTVKGDLHEIGKDLVKIILETGGIRVLDLGVDVPEEEFLLAARSTGARIVGLSAFISSARKQLTRTVDRFQSEGLSSVKILVGGAAVNQQTAMRIGAHGYARDAIGAVRLVKEILRNCEKTAGPGETR